MLECLKCNYTTEENKNRCPICNEVLYPKDIFFLPEPNIMGGGNTPMFSNKTLTKIMGCKTLNIKNEGCNPTGSFKDRGTNYEIKIANNRGYYSVVVASTGNMGASVAAYCAYYGLECFVFVPKDTAQNKLNQIKMYGGQIKLIDGNYYDCMIQAEKYAFEHEKVFLSGDYHLRMLGMMSLGKEIILDCNGIPDYIFVPIGNGNLLYSLFLSLKQFTKFKMPKLMGVQIEHYDGLTYNFHYGSGFKTFNNYKTKATAVNITNPLQGLGALKAVKETNGNIMSVSDRSMLEAQKMLAERGLFLEPSGALSFAGLVINYKFYENKNVVCIGTGNGLKDSDI